MKEPVHTNPVNSQVHFHLILLNRGDVMRLNVKGLFGTDQHPRDSLSKFFHVEPLSKRCHHLRNSFFSNNVCQVQIIIFEGYSPAKFHLSLRRSAYGPLLCSLLYTFLVTTFRTLKVAICIRAYGIPCAGFKTEN